MLSAHQITDRGRKNKIESVVEQFFIEVDHREFKLVCNMLYLEEIEPSGAVK